MEQGFARKILLKPELSGKFPPETLEIFGEISFCIVQY